MKGHCAFVVLAVLYTELASMSVRAEDFVGPLFPPPMIGDPLLPRYDAWCKVHGKQLDNTTAILTVVGVNKTATITKGYGRGMTEFQKLTLDARDLSVYSQLLTRVIVDTNSVLGQQVSQCVTQNTAKFTAVLTAMNTAVRWLNSTTPTQTALPHPGAAALLPYEQASTALALLKASMRDLAEIIYSERIDGN